VQVTAFSYSAVLMPTSWRNGSSYHIHGRFVHVELPATRRIYGLSAFLPRAELTFDGRDQRIKVSRLHEIRGEGLRRSEQAEQVQRSRRLERIKVFV
jgi:hypothetical protein